ncbi:hypothetical protein V1506DRAFT_534537 [Lipomyces tetrasporus]
MTIELSGCVPTRASPSMPGVSIHNVGTRTSVLGFSKSLSPDRAPAILARGHAQGITLLRPIIYRTYRLQVVCEIYVGSPTKLVKVVSGSPSTLFVVSVHADYSVRTHVVRFEDSGVVNEQIAVLAGTSGHAAPVLCLDAALSGNSVLTATASDDNTLIISSTGVATGEYNAGPRAYRLSNTASDIVFLPEASKNRAKVSVLEGTSRIRVIDCLTGRWLLSIYPRFTTAISSFAVSSWNGAAVVAVTDLGWRAYKGVTNIQDGTESGLRGGSGYTYPSDHGLFRGKTSDKAVGKVVTTAGKVIAKISVGEEGGVGVFDIGSNSEFGTHVPVKFTTTDISVAAVSEDGQSVAVACGTELFLVSLGGEPEVGMDSFEEDSVVYNERLPIGY